LSVSRTCSTSGGEAKQWPTSLRHSWKSAEPRKSTVWFSTDRGGTRTRPDDGSANAVRVPSKTLLHALNEESVTSIDALKIDVEGAEDTILMPFFQDAPQSLWPRFLVIEDTSGLWRVDVFAELKARGYREAGRSRQNVMMER